MTSPSWPQMPSFSSLPSIPSYQEVKQGTQDFIEDVTGIEFPGAEEAEEIAPEDDNQVNQAVADEPDFAPGGFVMPSRPEPRNAEVTSVIRLREVVQQEDLETLQTYEDSRSQFDITDPQAFLLERAAGYADYMPAIAQDALTTQLDNTYTQAMRNDIAYVLDQHSGNGFSALPAAEQERVLDLICCGGALEALLPEIQGEGGAGAAQGITSGEEGHYVNSTLTSMAQLLSQGKVDSELIDSLESLRSADLDPELESQAEELFNSAIQNIAFPESISQHSRGTCAATRVEALMALDDPSGYIDTVRRLASPSGRAREEGGFLHRVEGTAAADDSGRSVASRLLQPALMEMANGRKLDYNNLDDLNHINPHGERSPNRYVQDRDGAGGLTTIDSRRLIRGVFGEDRVKEFSSIFGNNGVSREEVVSDTEDMMANGDGPLLVDLDWGDDGGHALLLSDLDADNAYFMNPWGELHTMPREEFDSRLRFSMSVTDPPALPPAAQDHSNYHELPVEDYFSPEQLLTLEVQRDLLSRAENIQDPQLRSDVEQYLERDLSQEALMELVHPLIAYLDAQGGDTESELSDLRLAIR